MSNREIVRAWKDGEFRRSLSESQLAVLPEHPAGLVEVTGAEMQVGGGAFIRATVTATYTYTVTVTGTVQVALTYSSPFITR